MGFSGGGSNVLKPHTHDSGILQDGGSLNFDGVTQSSMSAGSITYSDSNNLQELVIGNQYEELRVNTAGTALEYFDTSAHGRWQLLDQHDVGDGSTESTYTKSFSPALDMLAGGDYNQLYVVGKGRANATCNIQMKLNALTEYHTQNLLWESTAITAVADYSATEVDLIPISLMTGAHPFQFGINITQNFVGSGNEDLAYWGTGMCGNNRGYIDFRGNTVNQGDADVTSFELKTSASDYSGLQLAIYGIKQ
jgi:hypothetical protein